MALYIETLTTRQVENFSTAQIESLLVEAPLIVEQLTTAQVENLTVEQIENLIPTPVISPVSVDVITAGAEGGIEIEVVSVIVINNWST